MFSVPAAVAAVLVAVLGACSQGEGPASTPAKETDRVEEMPEVLANFVVKAGDAGLLFQYVDPVTGEFATTQEVAKVPEPARSNVIVFSSRIPKGQMPPELIILTDLTTPAEDGTYPFRLVSRYGTVAPTTPLQPSVAKPPAAPGGNDSVILFSTTWCPHCRRARDWLAQQGIPFVEKDVEADATAASLLQQLAQAQGVPQQMLSSVPILAVKGQLVMGFDPNKILALLGK